jgi:hypothetical protein
MKSPYKYVGKLSSPLTKGHLSSPGGNYYNTATVGNRLQKLSGAMRKRKHKRINATQLVLQKKIIPRFPQMETMLSLIQDAESQLVRSVSKIMTDKMVTLRSGGYLSVFNNK